MDGIDKYIKDTEEKGKEAEKTERNSILERETQNIWYSETKTTEEDKNKKSDSFNKTKPGHMTQNNFHWGMTDNVLNDKLISSKLDEARTKFDMNKFMNDIRQKRAKEGKDKELMHYVPN